MKLRTVARPSALLLCLVPLLASPQQLPFQKPFKHSTPTHASSQQENFSPYSIPWIAQLQTIYNTFGVSENGTCPTEIQKWSCQPYELTEKDWDKPTDVWHLRPHDIKSVVSIGDSITAGFAMLTGRPPFAIALEYRGKVFSDGGDSEEYTLANFLRTYTKDIHGSPRGFTLPLAQGKGLNTGVSGAIVQMLPWQVERLRLLFGRFGPYRKYKNEWKLATILIGANNLCDACGLGGAFPALSDPEKYGAALKSALRRLKGSIGPTFVNLVGIFDVTLVYDLSRGHPYCEMLLGTLPICSCATGSEANRQKAGYLAKKYNEVMERIAKEINEENKDDGTFGVVFQPGLTGFKEGASQFGQGYLSKFDCFHPNKCANQVMAITLWNNMFSSPEDKKTPFRPKDLEIYCPGRNDYLR
ncbi:hypothetical protein BGZ65_003004 [Modicella reniformis]|uniref:Uncharacterized protein n=1 Tax=Modicella reniformis TaxID=1440133 RepID=A0A9P6J007_9FUNG|nr:hypothetical protein BGZ65_003004 [Modicella reniformis]